MTARSIPILRAAGALTLLGPVACMHGGDAREPGDDPAAVRGLPGYAGALEPEPVFGGDIWVRRAGPPDAHPVVLVHGSGQHGSRSFDRLIVSLAEEGYRVVALDLPGFGRSSKGNRRYTPFRYAKVVRHVVGRHTDRPITLVGHSLGGNVALLYAALRPEDVERLVVLDVVGVLHREIYMRRTMPAGAMIARAMRYPGPDQPRAQELLEDPELRARYLRSPMAIAGLALMLDDLGPVLDRIRAPTLILWGDEDRIADLRAARALRARLSTSQLTVIEGAGHAPMRERPVLVSERVRRWVHDPASVDPPEPARRALEGVERVGRCKGEEGKRFEGAWARLELTRCGGVRIEDATIGQLSARDSVVSLDNARIASEGVAVEANDSVVEMTGGSVEGRTCFESHGSQLDLAGAVLRCRETAVHSTSRSTLLFSVTRLEGREGPRHLHELRSLGAGERLF